MEFALYYVYHTVFKIRRRTFELQNIYPNAIAMNYNFK